ncbi:MAG: hypothetical protein ACFFD7_15165, partial [Candidatus Thorarchaeota archaeon]
IIEEPVKTDKEKLRVALNTETQEEKRPEVVLPSESIKDVIIKHLKAKGIIATKPQFVDDIIAKGFTKNKVEKEIDNLKEQGIITYSRAKPKGWSLTE